jgi:isocitrate lyase
MTAIATRPSSGQPDLVATPLLPEGFGVPPSRWVHPSVRMRELLRTEPYLFGPGVYDPFGAQLVMHHGFKAVYFSGYSFAIGHLGTTDMDLYSGPEIADGARRTVSALRKYQLTAAVGDPEKGIAPRHLDIPPVIVDMDAGYGNIFNVQRQTELLVTAASRPRISRTRCSRNDAGTSAARRSSRRPR